jgi:DNA-binding GntR family transcriptional regulator
MSPKAFKAVSSRTPTPIPAASEPLPDGRRVNGRKAGGMAERVREHVYKGIVSGALKPGSIIQIASIAAELGVSRTPVREALLALQQSNVVSVVPNQGFLVNTMSVADLRDIYTMRGVLEGATAQRSAQRLSDDDLKVLDEINRESHEVATSQYDIEFDRCCHSFHRQVALGADSARLLAALEAIFGDAQRLQSIGVNPPDPRTVLAEHQAIYEALAARDSVAARECMEAHIATLHRTAMANLID